MSDKKDPEVKLFTVELANRALPLVRRIVDDLFEEHRRWKELVSRYELAAGAAKAASAESAEMLELRRQVDALARRISGYVGELDQIGVALKGFDEGLVDFYGLHEGRVVCLCWRRGEPAVEHWHELDTGFAGRRPITDDFPGARVEPAPVPRR